MSYFKLRDYQQDLLDRYSITAEHHRCVMLQLSTGGGSNLLPEKFALLYQLYRSSIDSDLPDTIHAKIGGIEPPIF